MALEKPTKEQIEEGLKLLAKKIERDEKVAAGILKPAYKKVSEMSPKEKEAYDKQAQRYSIKVRLLREKAIKAGLTVTEAEVDAEVSKGLKK